MDLWLQLFDKKYANWSDDTTVSIIKAEALDLLFLQNPSFLKGNGVYVLRDFMAWCMQHASGDLRIQNSTKVRSYLEARVKGAMLRWEEDRDNKTNTKEECAVTSMRSAICHLDSVARWQGYLKGHESFWHEDAIRILYERLERAQNEARAAPRDYAASSRFLTKRLTPTEMSEITIAWWNGKAASSVAQTLSGVERTQMRGLLLHCLQKHAGRRGKDLRNLRLSMFFTHTIGSMPVIGASLRHVKECSENVEHLIGWTRSADRMSCPLGALACYFVWLNDLAGGTSILQDIRRDLLDGVPGQDRIWWRRMLVGDTEAPIAYTTHHKAVRAGFEGSGVTGKTAATHIYRTDVGCNLIEKGVAFTDVGLLQGWQHDISADRYLRGAFKTGPMLVAHGWDDNYKCFWDGNDEDIPAPLKEVVFPGLDSLYEDCRAHYHESGGHDRSAVELLKTMKFLRKVFLEDAVLKRSLYPSFPHIPNILFLIWCNGRFMRTKKKDALPRAL